MIVFILERLSSTRLFWVDFCKLFQWKTELFFMEKSPYDDIKYKNIYTCKI